jgi:hypothetical protein
MIEAKRETGQEGPLKTKIDKRLLLTSRVPGVQLERVVYELDGGAKVNAVVLKAAIPAEFGLTVHPLFAQKGIVVEGNKLINQRDTKKLFGETVGQLPEDTLKPEINGYALAPNHYGWMTGQVLIQDGRPVLIKSDQDTLTQNLTVVGLQNGRWTAQEVSFRNGELQNPDVIEGMHVGFSMPLLVKDREVVPLEEAIDDPRYLGDLRNVFDFATGEKMHGDFWLNIRPLLPESIEDARKLLSGQTVVTETNKLTKAEIERLSQLIKENEKVNKVLKIKSWQTDDGLQTQLTIDGKLPFNRIPLIGSGYDKHGNFVAMIIGGRNASTNATLPEAAEMMADFMRTGGFGPAGGDVSLVDNEGNIYNEVIQTRPHPVALTITEKKAA